LAGTQAPEGPAVPFTLDPNTTLRLPWRIGMSCPTGDAELPRRSEVVARDFNRAPSRPSPIFRAVEF